MPGYKCVELESQPSLTRVSDLDPSDKPREKALQHGIDKLTDAELLAIILGSGMQGKSVLDLSREMLRYCDNNLARLARMNVHELTRKFDGIGPAKAVSLIAAFEAGKRYRRDLSKEDSVISGSDSVYNLIRGKMENLQYEQFMVLHLNRANRVIFEEEISKGGIASTLVDVKIVMKSAIDKLSSGLIFAHNHPSGTLSPSVQDDQLTQKLKKAAETLDIRVLDHLIISPKGYYSYSDNGRL